MRGAALFAAAAAMWIGLGPSSAWAGGAQGCCCALRIGAVYASKTGSHFDRRLLPIRTPIRRLFRGFHSYRLIAPERRRRVDWGEEANFYLPGGHYLQVVPKGHRGDRVAMHVLLLSNERALVDTDFELRNRGVILVGGPRYQEGLLIMYIGAEVE